MPNSRILYAAFFLSGASSLVYQLTWARSFRLVFGYSVYSAAFVSSLFMLGLGVGAWLAGKWSDAREAGRERRKLVTAYSAIEVAIGAWALALAFFLPTFEGLISAGSSYVTEANGWQSLSAGSFLLRYSLAFFLVFPPAAFMGSTLTLLGRYLAGGKLAVTGGVGFLYAINTAGAAFGAFSLDAFLAPFFGVTGAIALAAAGSLAAALLASRLKVEAGEGREKSPLAEFRRDGLYFRVGTALFASGFAGMALEILWFRHLTSFFGGNRAVLSLLLVVILVGIWLGATLSVRLTRRFGRPALFFGYSQAFLIFFVLLELLHFEFGKVSSFAGMEALVGMGEIKQRLVGYLYLGGILARELGLPSLLLGFAYPMGIALFEERRARIGTAIGELYLWNTAGGAIGGLAAGFFLLPLFGMQATFAGVALGSLVACLSLALTGRKARLSGFLPALAVLALIFYWQAVPALTLARRALPSLDFLRVVAIKEGVGENVAVLEHRATRVRYLYTNGFEMASTDPRQERYMRAFAHIPLLQMASPERALVICYGAGNTAQALTLHSRLREIEVVDLSRDVLRSAGLVSPANAEALRDPRVKVFVNDGRFHLRMRPAESYDLITLEPPPLAHAGVAALYSREFYEEAASRLREGGFITQWLQIFQVSHSAGLAAVRAFVDVFPESVLISGDLGQLILIGRKGAKNEFEPALASRLLEAEPKARDDLARLWLKNPKEILLTFLAGGERLRAATKEAFPVTDDFPALEYSHAIFLESVKPRELFAPGEWRDWCPSCQGPEYADVDAAAAVLSAVYLKPGFLYNGTAHFRGEKWEGPTFVREKYEFAPRVFRTAYDGFSYIRELFPAGPN